MKANFPITPETRAILSSPDCKLVHDQGVYLTAVVEGNRLVSYAKGKGPTYHAGGDDWFETLGVMAIPADATAVTFNVTATRISASFALAPKAYAAHNPKKVLKFIEKICKGSGFYLHEREDGAMVLNWSEDLVVSLTYTKQQSAKANEVKAALHTEFPGLYVGYPKAVGPKSPDLIVRPAGPAK